MPFLIKDVFGHEKGRKIEFGSRLCEGMTVEVGTYFADMLKAAGVNILGRSAAPEYSMSATTESVMFGNTSNPWKKGYSAGGSSGGAQAAVTRRHGADRARLRHRRLDPHSGQLVRRRRPEALARARLGRPGRSTRAASGYSTNFVQAKTVRDVAAMLDCVSIPQPGDPFIIPKPDEPYADARQEGAAQAQDRHRARRAGRA